MIIEEQREILATVTICTRNRAESLRRTLNSIVEAAEGVTDAWEIQIVDNGSSDHTKSVVEDFSSKLPIRHVSAPIPGLSNARNVGVQHVQGKFLIWTDDDVLVHRDWLRAYLDVFRVDDGEYSVFGGRSTPIYEEPSEKWFIAAERHLGGLLAIRDESSWFEIAPNETPWGLNFAVRTSVQREHLFDPELGVAPNRRRGGEETQMILSAMKSGEKGRWVWGAQVFHLIPKERQSLKYIAQYYRALGYDYWVVQKNIERGSLSRLAFYRYVTLRLLKIGILWPMRDSRWVFHYARFWQAIGNLEFSRGKSV